MAFTRDELIRLYNEPGLSTRDIAKVNGVTRAAIVYHMKKFGISRRKGNQPKPFTYNNLYQLYVVQRMSTHQIAEMKDCAHATIKSCFRRAGIKLRSRREALFGRKVTLTAKFLKSLRKNQAKRWAYLKDNPPFTDEELRDLYLVRGLGTREIAKIKNTTHRKVLSWMKRYNIKRRSFSEAHKVYIESHPERLQNMVLALKKGCIHPNKSEKKVLQILNKHNFPFKYVGNGSFSIGSLNPDFVATDDSKRVIEFFGDHWHEPDEEQERVEALAEFGYEALIVWEHELKDEDAVLSKIENWMEG